MMTRKDYVAFAGAMSEAWKMCDALDMEPDWATAWCIVRDEIERVLKADNPRFDRERFVAATRT